MGDGLLGLVCNVMCIIWTLFVSVLFSLPTYFPVTKDNMNYASVITVAVITSSLCVSRSSTSSVRSLALFRLKKGSGISLGTLPCLRALECNRSSDDVYSARLHYKGPVSYTDGHGELTKESREDQSDRKGPDVTVKWVFVPLLIK